MDAQDKEGAEKAKAAGYYADKGLLWLRGEMIPLPRADWVAQEYGFMFAERLVKALTTLEVQHGE